MKITRLTLKVVSIPLPTPIPSARIVIKSADCILAMLHTDEGAAGEGMVFTLNGHRLSVLHETIRSLEPLLVGLDPGMSGAFWSRAWADIAFLGHRGATVVGLSALDMALWDLRGKQAGLNVSRLIGACRDTVPIYRSGSLRLSSSIDQLQKEAAGFVKDGYRAMKMSLGKPSAREDVARVRAVREALGPDVRLMADCNQQFTADRAIRLGRQLEEFDLAWIEEPVPYHDHMAEAAVAAALDTPIASGESEYARFGMLDMLRNRSADILMPDLQRMGGPTEFLKVAHLAEAHNTPISPHLFTEMSLSLAAALPNAIYAEHMPWFAPLYGAPIELDGDGNAVVPTAPGWGYAFDPEAVARFAVQG
jgi:L-alanine-DL-glutamate epimerase-like enolase superfamily enzyme